MPTYPSGDADDPLAHNIHQVLESFIDELLERECSSHFYKVLESRYYLQGRPLLQEPERFIEDHLVFPMLEQALGYSLRPRPKQYAPRWPRGGGVPDFCITSIPFQVAKDQNLRVFGEVKSPKNLQEARDEMEDYLNSDIDVHAIAILSDGFDWELWVRPRNHAVADVENPYAKASLRSPLKALRRRTTMLEPYPPEQVRNRIDVEGFAAFELEALLEVARTEFGAELPALS